MTSLIEVHPLPFGLAALLAGLALGLFHFSSLRRVSALYLSGGPVWRALTLQLARFAFLIGLFVLLARAGATPLLAGALGLLIGRAVVLRSSREAG